MKCIGLVVKADGEAQRRADTFQGWLRAKGMRVVRRDNLAVESGTVGPDKAPDGLFCVFVLGGDGTFLSAVRWIGDQPVPILGVKFGQVGFLAESSEESLTTVAEAILANAFTTTRRARLSVEVRRGGRQRALETVLNDVVINRGALARLAYIDTHIDERYLTTYVADGLIVSTPTGSTAYSLAAGGPIIHPSVPAVIIAPICPFSLTVRPLIVPDSVCIRVRLAKKAADIMLTFDGQAGLSIDERDEIVVRKGAHPVHLITVPGKSYFDVVKAKLLWGAGKA